MKRFANDSELKPFFLEMPGDPSNARSGRIYGLANDANFDAAHLSEPLTEYAVGIPDRDRLQETLDTIAPAVPVGRRFEYLEHNERAAFQQDADDDSDIREIGGEFKTVSSKGTKKDSSTDNKGLTIILDNDQGGENEQVQRYYTAMLKNRLLRTELKRVIGLIHANATAGGTPNWGTANAGRDPDADLLTLVDDSGDARGINPNIVVLGGTAAVKRKISLRSSDKAGAFASAAISYDDLAESLEVDRVVPVRARYQTGANTRGKIAGLVAYTYYAQNGLTKDDPSNVKRFVSMTPSGMYRVYIESILKRTKITVEHYSRTVITSALGIRKLEPTFTNA